MDKESSSLIDRYQSSLEKHKILKASTTAKKDMLSQKRESLEILLTSNRASQACLKKLGQDLSFVKSVLDTSLRLRMEYKSVMNDLRAKQAQEDDLRRQLMVKQIIMSSSSENKKTIQGMLETLMQFSSQLEMKKLEDHSQEILSKVKELQEKLGKQVDPFHAVHQSKDVMKEVNESSGVKTSGKKLPKSDSNALMEELSREDESIDFTFMERDFMSDFWSSVLFVLRKTAVS